MTRSQNFSTNRPSFIHTRPTKNRRNEVDMFDLQENIQGQTPPRVEISSFLIQYQCLTYWEKLDIAAGISPLIGRHLYILGLQKNRRNEVDMFDLHENIQGQRPPRVEISSFLIQYQCLTYWEKLDIAAGISPLIAHHLYILGL